MAQKADFYGSEDSQTIYYNNVSLDDLETLDFNIQK